MNQPSRPTRRVSKSTKSESFFDFSEPIIKTAKRLTRSDALGIYIALFGTLALFLLAGVTRRTPIEFELVDQFKERVLVEIGLLVLPLTIGLIVLGLLISFKKIVLLWTAKQNIFPGLLAIFFCYGLISPLSLPDYFLDSSSESYTAGGELGSVIRGSLVYNTLWLITGIVAIPIFKPRLSRHISKLTIKLIWRSLLGLWHLNLQVRIPRAIFRLTKFFSAYVTERRSANATGKHIAQSQFATKDLSEISSDLAEIAGPRTDSLATSPRQSSTEQFVIVADPSIPEEAAPRQVVFSAEQSPSDAPPEIDQESLDKWRLPPLALLRPGEKQATTDSDNDKRARVIENTLSSHGVDVTVTEINEGPAVTQFGITPGWDIKTKAVTRRNADGEVSIHQEEISRSRVRVKAITSLQNDLALALATQEIRIEAPVPGKTIIGLEVPNSQTQLVMLRDILESKAWQSNKGDTALGIPLGSDISGQAVVADLTKMPHLLIAGATGSGKSVCLNAIISGLLMQHTPDTLRLVLIDPKRVEMTAYQAIPHLAFSEIVRDLDRVLGTLQAVANEMDTRYRRFQAMGVRNIQGFNEKQTANKLPYWVVVIDELADLMMTAPDQVQRLLVRLAQLARATGIHVIVATQRPSVDVITGLIKANFPTRIAFAVSSLVDSRTIIDGTGAEKLLGRGDMLYVPPGADKAKRVQGVFVSDNEIASVADYWSAASAESLPPDKHDNELEEAVLQAAEVLANELDSNGTNSSASPIDDPLYQRALLLGAETGELSTSMLQRKLGIGYPRAARIMDQLEDNGVVGPIAQAGKPRPVISLGSQHPQSPNTATTNSDPSSTGIPRAYPPERFDES